MKADQSDVESIPEKEMSNNTCVTKPEKKKQIYKRRVHLINFVVAKEIQIYIDVRLSVKQQKTDRKRDFDHKAVKTSIFNEETKQEIVH